MIYVLIFIAYVVIVTVLAWYVLRKSSYLQRWGNLLGYPLISGESDEDYRKRLIDSLRSAPAIDQSDIFVSCEDYKLVILNGKKYWIKNEHSDFSDFYKNDLDIKWKRNENN